MSTLTEVLSLTTNPLSGVKRPLLGNPTTLSSQQPAFRGAPNEPGKAIKVPKLSNGNRPDRGTNITIPVARVTALTSIQFQNGRLSPGDVCFVRRTPGGFTGALKGNSKLQIGGHMSDMFGIDGVNRMLSGSMDGTRRWRIGYNVINANPEAAVPGNPPPPNPPRVDGIHEDLFDFLKVLKMHTLDGIIMSNEEPHSFGTTGGRDATVFNIAVQGPAATNNGFLNYESHSGAELYSRGYDADAFHETVPVTSERANETWHGKAGYDFVAAYTNHYTQYPLQMFDRHPQVLDRAYLILRRYNLFDDVFTPRIEVLQASRDRKVARLEGEQVVLETEAVARLPAGSLQNVIDAAKLAAITPAFTAKIAAARAAALAAAVRAEVFASSMVSVVDGLDNDAAVDFKAMTDDELKKMFFFQYMPCTSRAFQLFKYRKLAQTTTYSSINKDAQLSKKEKMDAVRDLDIENCVGAWCLGKIVDPYMSRAARYAGSPVNSSYRIQINVSIQWMPRNKELFIDGFVWPGADDTELARDASSAKIKQTYLLNMRDRVAGSQARFALANSGRRSLVEVEALRELPKTDNYPAVAVAERVAGVAEANADADADAAAGAFADAAAAEAAANPYAARVDDDESGSMMTVSMPIQAAMQASSASTTTTTSTSVAAASAAAQAPALPRTTPAVATATTLMPSSTVAAAQTNKAKASSTATTKPAPPSHKAAVSSPRAAPAAIAAAAASASTTTTAPVTTPMVSTTPVVTRSSPMVEAAVEAAKRKASLSAAPNPTARPPASRTHTSVAAAASSSASTTAPKPTSVVDSVFDTIFGSHTSSSAAVQAEKSDPPSPTPSSGSESAPKTFARRNR